MGDKAGWAMRALVLVCGVAAAASVCSAALPAPLRPTGALRQTASGGATPQAACFDILNKQPPVYRTRPLDCTIIPAPSSRTEKYGNGLMTMRWTTWNSSEAQGRGASYRLWADVKVRLFAPKRVCGKLLFTRATVHYVDGDPKYWPDKTFPLKTC